jgi:type VI secretion system secreted protein Hcp
MIISRRSVKHSIPLILVATVAAALICWFTLRVGASAGSPSSEHASGYIKFDGVDGEVFGGDHEDWSNMAQFEQGIRVPAGGVRGSVRRRADAVLDDIQVVKVLDKSSPKLAEAVLKGKVFPKVEIHLTGPSSGSLCTATFLAYELKNVLITRYHLGGSSIEPVHFPGSTSTDSAQSDQAPPLPDPGVLTFYPLVDAPLETLSLNFEEIKVTYTECDSLGRSRGNVEYSWRVE